MANKTFYNDVEAIEHNEPPFMRPVVSETSKGYSIYHLWLTKEIEEPFYYDDWFRVCNKATSEDVIVVHINSGGGVLDTAIQIYNALVTSDAPVFVSIEGGCCSGASLIAMAGDDFNMSPLAYMMIHSMSGGTVGKLGNMVENAEFQKKWFSNVMHFVYKDFCSKPEIESILAGKDLWLDSNDVMARFKEMLEKRHSAAEKANQKVKTARDRVEKMLATKGMRLNDIL